MYGGPLVCDLTDLSELYDYARVLNHEMGHSLDLDHVTYCNNQCNTVDINPELECNPRCPGIQTCDNFNPGEVICNPDLCIIDCTLGEVVDVCKWGNGKNMLSQGGSNKALTPCQWEVVFNRVLNLNTPKYSWADNCTEEAPDIYIGQGENVVWNSLKLLNRNVIVETGATLTVSCEVRMSRGMQFIVNRGAKLIIDEGTITSLCTDVQWGGIVVHGNASKEQPEIDAVLESDDSGVLIVRNSSLIENTKTAITTKVTGVTYSQQIARRGGLIHCEHSTFQNNERVAEFMKYDFENKSKFLDCLMDGDESGNYGVTIWATNGITFNQCQINNMSRDGLVVYNAGAIVKDENIFSNNARGIKIYATHPHGSKLEIGDNDVTPNQFENNTYHIQSVSSAFGGGLQIVNNVFNESTVAVYLRGPSQFQVDRNIIGNSFAGIYTGLTGSLGWNSYNYIRENNISANYGIYAAGSNKNMQFLCNDFSCYHDFNLINGSDGSQGEIRLIQGGTLFPAGNCFTNAQSSGDITTSNASSLFYYYVKSVNPATCEIPSSQGNYLISSSNGTDCQPFGLVNTPDDTAYGDIKEELDNAEYGTTGYYEILEQKDNIVKSLIKLYLNDDDLTSVYALLEEENTREAKKMKYGIQLEYDDFQGAKQTLYELSNDIESISSFNQVQKINMQRIMQDAAFEMSESDSLYLESVAENNLASAGYARAILSLLYAREFDTIIEEMAAMGYDNGEGKLTLTNESDVTSH